MNSTKTVKFSPVIFAVCFIAYTSIYIARLNLSMASAGMIDAGILDSAKIGMLGSVFSVIFAVGRLINGGISDRQPPYIMLTSGLIAAGISNIAVGFFPPYIGILVLWMTNAYAQSMLWSSVLCVVSAIYDERKAKKMTSYMVTSVAVGNILGIVINTYIITNFGLNFAFVIPGGFTIIMGVAVLFATRKIKNTGADAKKHMSIPALIKEKNIRTSLVPTLMHGVMKDNISLWMTVYFIDKFDVDLEKSALFVLFIPLVGFIGRIIYPFCYKLCKENEHTVSVASFIICIIAAIPLAAGIVNTVTAAICLSMIYAAVSLINTSLVSIFPIRYKETGNVASISGVMDFATYLGAGIGSFIYGFVIKAVNSYSPMFASWGLISAVSLVLLLPMMKMEK